MRKLLLFLTFTAAALAQNVSPFAPPPFATDPSTCYVGQIYTNTGSPGVPKFCALSNFWYPMVVGPNTATVLGYAPLWGGTGGANLQAGLPVESTAGANALVETTGAGGIGVSLMPPYFPGLTAN